MPECYIRGTNIKYLRIPDEVIDLVKEDENSGGGRGGRGGHMRGGRGGGGGGRGRGGGPPRGGK